MDEQAAGFVARLAQSPQELPAGLCLYEPGWHQGVVGIVASRIKDRLHRPVIAFAANGENTQGELKGSGRSIRGFHMRDALDAIAGLGSDAAHVVDPDGRPLGVVTRQSAERARARGDQRLEPLVEAVPAVTVDTTLAKVYQLFGSGLPLAVVDGEGRLIGAVRPLEVLAELGRVEGVSEQLQQAKAQEAQT